jgi:hypothetical protein
VVGFVGVAAPVDVTVLAAQAPFAAVIVSRMSAGWLTASQEKGAA